MTIGNSSTTEDSYLDAARECILAVGVKRTTLTDIARRAGVSRMTLYRRWPTMRGLLADLMTREWLDNAATMAGADKPAGSATAARIATDVVNIIATLQKNTLFQKIIDVDPEVLLPYLLERPGRTQETLLANIEVTLAEGQREGTVRAGETTVIARAVLLATHGFAISAQTMSDVSSSEELGAELRSMLERYLAP